MPPSRAAGRVMERRCQWGLKSSVGVRGLLVLTLSRPSTVSLGSLPNVFGSYFPYVKNGDNIYPASLTRLLRKTAKALLSVNVANNLSHNTMN